MCGSGLESRKHYMPAQILQSAFILNPMPGEHVYTWTTDTPCQVIILMPAGFLNHWAPSYPQSTWPGCAPSALAAPFILECSQQSRPQPHSLLLHVLELPRLLSLKLTKGSVRFLPLHLICYSETASIIHLCICTIIRTHLLYITAICWLNTWTAASRNHSQVSPTGSYILLPLCLCSEYETLSCW